MGVFCPGEAAGILRAAPAALAARAAAALAGEHDRWILWLPVLIGSGIGFYFSLPVEPPPWLGPAALGAVLTGCIALRRAAGSLAYLGLLLAAATLAGFAAAQARTAAVAAPAVQERVGPTPIFGRIVKLERLGKGRRVTLDALEIDRLSPEELPARVRLRLNGKQPELAPGDRIRIYGVLSPPSPPTAPGAFDFQRQAFFARLGATGFGIGQAEVVSREPRQLDLWLSGLRARADGIIHASVPAPQASVTSALLTGERTAIPAPVMAAIRDSGLAHLLSISGLHIGLVAGFLYATMRLGLCLVPRLALGWPIQKWAAGVAVLGAGGYTLLSDATIPSQRAFLMVAVVFLGVICDRKAISMRLVAIAATAVLLAQPESLLGASFQMSFAAVVALIAAFDALYRKRVYRLGEGMLGRCLVYVALVALTTMVATAATAPYAIFHFQRFAVHSLPANLVAVPLTALWIMPFGVGALLAMPLGLAAPFLTAMGWGVTVVIGVAEEVASWPAAVAPLPAMPLAGLVGLTLGGLWLCLWRGRWRYAGIAALVAGMGSIALSAPPDILIDGGAKVIGVRTPDGRLALSPSRAARLEQASWLQQAGLDQPAPWPPPAGEGSVAERMRCDSLGCVFKANGKTVALMRRAEAMQDDCRRADVLVSLVPLHGACPRPVAVVDRFDLWREGAHALWLGDEGVRVLSVNGLRGNRPWVIRPQPRDRRTTETGRTQQAVR
ncbi:MAG: ComEC family competence protein [Rhodospirillales bacterium]|jgi:competence protein ComEC|nr:ComEC family competence protein [Rhodospirillales bacterium]